ncbi:MAG: hypothetical protein ACFNJI_07030, partial [Leptotrichia hongkongensis]
MARDRQPVLKRCRNLGLDPIVLGVNKKSNRNIRPNANRKLTEYGTQQREKQKIEAQMIATQKEMGWQLLRNEHRFFYS